MATTTAQKLGINEGSSVRVLGMSAADARLLVGELPDGAKMSDDAVPGADLVLFFATSVDGVREGVTEAWSATAGPGRCWVAYRKGAGSRLTASGETPLHRDTLQAVLAEVDLDGVTLISIDETWSAMRIKRV